MRRRVPVLLGAIAAVAAVAVALALVVRDGEGEAGAWGPPEASPAARASDASTAVTGDGTVLAAWTERRRGATGVMFAARPPGGGWSTPRVVLEPQPFGVRDPTLTADAGGNAVVTFSLLARQREVLMAAYRPADGEWEAPQALAPAAYGFYDGASALSDGTTAVAWGRPFVADGTLTATVRGPGAPWADGTPVAPSDGRHSRLSLAVLPDGGVVMAATADARGSRLSVLLRRPGRAWTLLPPPPAPRGVDLEAAVAVDPSGRPVLAWTRATADAVFLWTSTFDGGGWTGARRLDRAPGPYPFGPLAAATTDEGVLVAWTRWGTPWTRALARAVVGDGPVETLDAFAIPDMRDVAGSEVSPGPPPGRIVVGAGGPPVAMWDRLVGRDPAPVGEFVVSRAAGGSWPAPEPVRATPVAGWPLAVGTAGPATVAAWAEQVSPDRGGLRVVAAQRPG